VIQILKQMEYNIIATVAKGKLRDENYKLLLPLLKPKLAQHQKLRWYFEMDDFEGWGLHAFWKDVKFDIRHANRFERVAMIGDKKWEEWMTKSMFPFTSAEVQCFSPDQKEEALRGIKS
jgi:hypothetical protein